MKAQEGQLEAVVETPTFCQMCGVEIEKVRDLFIAKVGSFCTGCGRLTCNNCRTKPHDCRANLKKDGWL